MSRYSHLGRHAFFLIILVVVFFHAVARAQNFTTFTEWQVPTAGSEPLTVVPASKNSAFFAERSASKIGFVDMNQNEITELTLPAGSAPHGLIAQGRNVVFCAQNGHVAVVDP